VYEEEGSQGAMRFRAERGFYLHQACGRMGAKSGLCRVKTLPFINQSLAHFLSMRIGSIGGAYLVFTVLLHGKLFFEKTGGRREKGQPVANKKKTKAASIRALI
jgi:hypothetical protein